MFEYFMLFSNFKMAFNSDSQSQSTSPMYVRIPCLSPASRKPNPRDQCRRLNLLHKFRHPKKYAGIPFLTDTVIHIVFNPHFTLFDRNPCKGYFELGVFLGCKLPSMYELKERKKAHLMHC